MNLGQLDKLINLKLLVYFLAKCKADINSKQVSSAVIFRYLVLNAQLADKKAQAQGMQVDSAPSRSDPTSYDDHIKDTIHSSLKLLIELFQFECLNSTVISVILSLKS